MSAIDLLISVRPWSFPVTFGAIVVGNSLAYVHLTSEANAVIHFSVCRLFLSLLGGLLVHTVGNVVNTLYDFLQGVDKPEHSDDRALVDNKVTVQQLRVLSVVCTAGAFVVLALLVNDLAAVMDSPAFPKQIHPVASFFSLAFLGGFFSIAYTVGPLKLKYRALGDLCIVACYGPLLVLGAYLSQTFAILPYTHHSAHSSDPTATASATSTAAFFHAYSPLIFSIPVGLMTEAILHANNSRDRVHDAKAGAVTLAQLLGVKGSEYFFIALFASSYSCCAIFASVYGNLFFFLPFISAVGAQKAIAAFRNGQWKDICPLCGMISAQFAVLLAVAILFAHPN